MMPPASAIAAALVASWAIPPAGQAKALADLTALFDAIQTMVRSATVTVPSAGLVSAPPGQPVVGIAIGIIT